MNEHVQRDENGNPYITEGAAKKLHHMLIALGVFVVVLGVVASVAVGAKDSADNANRGLEREVLARSEGNRRSIVIGCVAVNELRDAVADLVRASSSTITQADVDRISDPELHTLVQAIVDRANASRAALQQKADRLPVLDCDAASQRGG